MTAETDQTPPGTIGQVTRIIESSGINIDPENIREFVEAPLVEACLQLWEKGIQTWESSANTDDGQPAYIVINFDQLSPENKLISQNLGGETYTDARDGIPKTHIRFAQSINPNTPVIEVVRWSGKLADSFQLQSAKWTTHFSLDEAYQQGIIRDEDLDDNGEVNVDTIAAREELYYSPDDNCFFLNERDFHRFHQGEKKI